jgi:phospholipase D1/2
MLPIAPFSVVNAVMGASHIRLKDFLLGTAIGMAPGIAITVIFVDRVAAAVTDPGLGTYAALAGVAAILVGFAIYVRRRFADIETSRQREGR